MYEDLEFPFENLNEDEKVIDELKQALVEATKRCLGKEKCALLFSGGLDSTVIAALLKKLGVEFTAYVVGFEDSKDVSAARKAAEELGINLKTITVRQEEMPELIRAVAWVTKTADPITVGVSIPLYAAAKAAALDGGKVVFSGSGGDELFAGYDSHAKALERGWEAVHSECIKRLHTDIDKDLVRDARICKHFGMEPRVPFMDMDVVRLALSIHPKLKISTGQNKLILRRVAEQLGVPKEISQRKKTAAQYGSGVNKALKKLSRRSGFESMKSYLDSQLVNVYKSA